MYVQYVLILVQYGMLQYGMLQYVSCVILYSIYCSICIVLGCTTYVLIFEMMDGVIVYSTKLYCMYFAVIVLYFACIVL